MGAEPLFDLRVFVRFVIVADHVDVTPPIPLRDRVEKRDELDVRMARKTLPVHLAPGELLGREQASGAVALTVMSHTGRHYAAITGMTLRQCQGTRLA